MVVGAYNPSYLGDFCRKITWTWGVEVAVGRDHNTALQPGWQSETPSQKNNKNKIKLVLFWESGGPETYHLSAAVTITGEVRGLGSHVLYSRKCICSRGQRCFWMWNRSVRSSTLFISVSFRDVCEHVCVALSRNSHAFVFYKYDKYSFTTWSNKAGGSSEFASRL